jgi:DNA-binding winged helix-turn-helix (wHTH) protein
MEHSPKQFGPFVLDERERILHREGEPVALTPKAFDLLTAFVREPDGLGLRRAGAR